MDALGKGCHSEDCTSALKIQSGKDAIGCTKAQQAVEDVGTSTCTYECLDNRAKLTTFRAKGTPRWRCSDL
jgi:membrane-bound inhibitor of C-type lysozyme